jgi:hypothetical protein
MIVSRGQLDAMRQLLEIIGRYPADHHVGVPQLSEAHDRIWSRAAGMNFHSSRRNSSPCLPASSLSLV